MSGIVGVSPDMKSGLVGKFPVGHIIQTTAVTIGTTETDIRAAAVTWYPTVVTASITTASASNSVILHAFFAQYIHDTGGDSGFSMRIKKVHSGGTTYPNEMSQHHTNSYSSAYYNRGNGDEGHSYHNTFQDPTCGVAGVITYTIEGMTTGVSNTANLGGTMGARWGIWFQEIQR